MTGAAIAPARRAAFDILRKVGRGRRNSDTLLHSLQVNQLSPQDRNLCTTLVLGTLRWQLVLDAECRKFLARPDLALPEDAMLALRVGAYQLLFLDRIPAHAALFESVEWCKHSDGARQAGLVNAVLRKVAALPKSRTFKAEQAYPEWMVARWGKLYGAEACRRICEQGQMEPETAVRLLDDHADEALRSQGVMLQPGAFLTKARRLVEGDASLMTLLESTAHVQLQDEGSQFVAELLGQGARVLDMCAAPGGKTAVLLQNNPGAELLACDLHPTRLATMQRRLRATMNLDHVELRVADAATLAGVGPFNRILCDVPCTGTGTLARNPEIRHRLQPEELARQAKRQREILSTGLRLLAPGGRLLYSTCSLESEENAAVVEACLGSAAEGAWHRLDLHEEFDRLEREGIVQGEHVKELRASGFGDGYLRTLPGAHPCDGFFAALIERL
ncbi:MAG TPA: transcription antitermination factor NusB [Acidobacteriaceae bacterium]|nr:transcription antitermination factor NusB [Acidobacteriaceae bacterium]